MVKRRWKITRIFKFHELHIFGDINLFLRKRENLKSNECVPFEWNLILINIIKNVTDTTFCFIKVKERKKMTSSYSGLFRKHVENVLLVISSRSIKLLSIWQIIYLDDSMSYKFVSSIIYIVGIQNCLALVYF